MKIKKWQSLAFGACLALMESIGTALSNPLPSVREVVEQTEHAAYYQGYDGSAQVNMTITDSRGRKRTRRLTILRRDQQRSPDKAQAGEQKYYVHIEHPADLRNTVLTVWKHGKKDDDRWLYLPLPFTHKSKLNKKLTRKCLFPLKAVSAYHYRLVTVTN